VLVPRAVQQGADVLDGDWIVFWGVWFLFVFVVLLLVLLLWVLLS